MKNKKSTRCPRHFCQRHRVLCIYDGLKKGHTFPLYLFKNQKTRANMRFYKNHLRKQVFYSIKEKCQSCLSLAPRTGETQPAGRHRPFACSRWRSKDCNLKRAAPSDVWGNLRIIVTTRKVMAGKSRWLMGSFLDRCGFAPAIATILAPTSLALFPWNVPIVLNIQFSRSRNYFLLYTPNIKFSLLVVTRILRVACKPAAAQRGLGRALKFAFGYPNAMLAKPSASRWGAFRPLFRPSR